MQSPNGIVALLETEAENAVVPGLSDAVSAATAAVVAAQVAHAQAQAQAHAQAQAEAQAQEVREEEEQEEEEQVELGEESEEEDDVSEPTLDARMMLTRHRILNSSWNRLTAHWISGRFHNRFWDVRADKIRSQNVRSKPSAPPLPSPSKGDL